MRNDFASVMIDRRTFINQATVGIGALALQDQLLGESLPSGIRLAGLPKAKRVIFLCMAGGP